MSQLRQHLPRLGLRPLLVGAALLTLLGAATLFYRSERADGVIRTAATGTGLARPAAKPPVGKPQENGPAFDIVRVSPDGTAVIAGTAAPGQSVIVRDDGREIGRATADGGGLWVLLPDQPMPPGAGELTLAARSPEGAEIAGKSPVVVLVPDRAVKGAPDTALAVLMPGPGAQTPPRVLGAPAGWTAKLDLDVVDYDDHGAVTFAGHAPPGARLRVYVDDKPAAEALADDQARWSGKPGAIAPGQHRVRVDQLDASGRVVGRVELPFQREAAPQAVAAGQVVVQPGATLWRLARQVYGQGMRYTVIYASNSAAIRDPNRIYPGQVFTLPDAAAVAAAAK